MTKRTKEEIEAMAAAYAAKKSGRRTKKPTVRLTVSMPESVEDKMRQQKYMSRIDTLTIQSKIRTYRGQRVILDADLAEMYGVPTKRLNEQVKRNASRFPADFMFQLTRQELEDLRSQIATTNFSKTRTPPFAFTELGVLMLSSVLNSETAVQVNIQIVRVFVKMREILYENSAIQKRLESIEKRLGGHDKNFAEIFAALKELYGVSEKEKRKRIGF